VTDRVSLLRFYPLAIGLYQPGEFDDLPVQDEIDRLTDVLAEAFDTEHIPWNPTAPDETAVVARLREWAVDAAEHDSFLVWMGHGDTVGDEVALAVSTTRKGELFTGLGPEKFADAIREWWFHQQGGIAVVVIEACGSARFAELVLARLYEKYGQPTRLLLIGTSGPGSTNLGLFTEALAHALTGPAFAASNEISLHDLTSVLYGQMPDATLHADPNPKTVLRRRLKVLSGPASLDVRAEFAKLPATVRAHFITKAQGGQLTEPAWFFTGRSEERSKIAAWLRIANNGMLVITGAPGSGKSALLGDLVMQSRPDLRGALTGAGLIPQVPEDQRPPDEAFDATLHLTGLTADQVIAQIGAAAALKPPSTESTTEQVRWLVREIGARKLTILIDALDESQQSLLIARDVLRPLAELPTLRMIVGTRRSAHEGPDQQNTDQQDLLDALQPAHPPVIVRRDPDALRDYVERRLNHAIENQELPESARSYIADIAAQIATKDEQRGITPADATNEHQRERFGFLFAHLAVHEVLARPELLNHPTELLAGDHRTLFSQAAARLTAQRPVAHSLLHALALSQGRGLPIPGDIWAIIAGTLHGQSIPADDITWVTEAGKPYLIADAEAGQTVFRLAHATFAEHFVTSDDSADHRRIVEALVSTAVLRGEEWINPYMRSHLASHAAAGGMQAWQTLAENTQILDNLEPASVAMAAFSSSLPTLPPEIMACIGSRHLLESLSPAARAGVRQLGMARFAGVRQFGEPDPHANWHVRWADLRPQVPNLALTGHLGRITAMALFSLQGQQFLASGDEHGFIHIWDPVAGLPHASISNDSDHITSLVAITESSNRTLLACASAESSIKVWDTVTLTQVAKLRSSTLYELNLLVSYQDRSGRIHLVAVDEWDNLWDWLWPEGEPKQLTPGIEQISHIETITTPRGDVALVCAGENEIFLVDPKTGKARSLSPGDRFAIFTEDNDKQQIAIADGNTIRIKDIWTRKQVCKFRTDTRTYSLIAVPTPNRKTLIAAADEDGPIGLWDPVLARRVNWLSGHLGGTLAIKVFRDADGQSCLATGGSDTEVRLWNPFSTAASAYNKERPYRVADVRAAVFVPGPDGQDYLATGGSRGLLHIWDGMTGRHIREIRQRDSAALITALRMVRISNGPTLLAAVIRNGPVRLWDPATGELVRLFNQQQEYSPRHSVIADFRSRSSITNFRWPDGRSVTAIGEWDGVIHISDPVSGHELRELMGHTGRVSVVVNFTSQDGMPRLASASADGTVRVWNPINGTQLHRCEANDRSGFRRVRALTVFATADGRTLLASGGSSGVVRVWDPESGSLESELPFDSEIFTIVAGPPGLAVGAQEGVAVIYLLPQPSG
jgi:WD40 repeat protein